jgi:ComF family protein
MNLIQLARQLTLEIWPNRCAACGRRLDTCKDDVFCSICSESLMPISSPCCPLCALPFEGRGPDHCCAECLVQAPAFSAGKAVYQYGEAAAKAVIRLKYGRMTYLAPVLGETMVPLVRRLPTPDVVVPVPLHRKKLRKRGFNQSALIAGHLGRALGCSMATDAIIRQRWTTEQAGLTRAERKANLVGAFALWRVEGIAGKRVLVVDDVMTTGATLREVARVLKLGGAKKVVVVTFARAC